MAGSNLPSEGDRTAPQDFEAAVSHPDQRAGSDARRLPAVQEKDSAAREVRGDLSRGLGRQGARGIGAGAGEGTPDRLDQRGRHGMR